MLLGLSGPIEVKGAKFNAMMPPPPGLTDEKIAEAITFARSHFGNAAGKVEPEHVAKVRASLAGRTDPLTTDELRALRSFVAGRRRPRRPNRGQAGRPRRRSRRQRPRRKRRRPPRPRPRVHASAKTAPIPRSRHRGSSATRGKRLSNLENVEETSEHSDRPRAE